MEPLTPALRSLTERHGWDASRLDFYIVHAGGPRILNDLCRFLYVEPEAFRFSRATLTEYGNIASAVVLDAVRRLFEHGGTHDNARGLIAGFGPGITAEIALGTWTGNENTSITLAVSRPERQFLNERGPLTGPSVVSAHQ